MHSYTTPGASNWESSLQQPTLGEVFWLEAYDAIRGLLGITFSADHQALRQALAYSEYSSDVIRWCCEAVNRANRVCVVGCSAELEQHVDELWSCDIIVSSDSAVGFLMQYGVLPEVVVGDLDGAWGPVLEALLRGSRAVITVHGDNENVVRALLPMLPPSSYAIVGQVPHPLVKILPGFTDGDKALLLAVLCAKPGAEVVLVGMNFDGLVGRWSKPWLRMHTKPWRSKRLKLRVAKIVASIASRLAAAKNLKLREARGKE